MPYDVPHVPCDAGTIEHQLDLANNAQDADGSGAIDAGELGAALKLLGVRAAPSEVAAMLDSVGGSDSGEIEYPQFVHIMTDVLTRPPARV